MLPWMCWCQQNDSSLFLKQFVEKNVKKKRKEKKSSLWCEKQLRAAVTPWVPSILQWVTRGWPWRKLVLTGAWSSSVSSSYLKLNKSGLFSIAFATLSAPGWPLLSLLSRACGCAPSCILVALLWDHHCLLLMFYRPASCIFLSFWQWGQTL